MHPFGEVHADQTLQYELEVARQVTAPVDQQLQQFARQSAAAYVVLTGGLDRPLADHQATGLRKLLLWLLDNLVIRATRRLYRYISGGIDLGYRQATELPHRAGIPLPPRRDGLGRELIHAINQMDERANGLIRNTAAQLIRAPLRHWDDTSRVVANTRRAQNTVEQTTRWAANRAISNTIRDVAMDLGAHVVWVAERNACLHCLAYAGEVVSGDGWFPGGLTFYRDPSGLLKPVSTEPVWSPPLHPNCRCGLELWAGYDVERWGPEAVSLVGIPQVLKREAQRSVLRGLGGFNSEPARLRAADGLLVQAGLLLGSSVLRRAREDIDAGEFLSTSRVRR
jgi:hypothetical protein